ncbi:MAG: hypothetical protein IT566_16170 [Rhodospirillaceae bacterium]|nr:hypothetical protein [Rhodospirillaceae bacterium]
MSGKAALAGLLLAATPARADDGAGIDQLLNFVANGCVRFVVDGASPQTFAKEQRAQAADEKTARAFLGADTGAVYLKEDPQHPIALVERTGRVCTVNARFPGDLAPIIEAADDYFAGPGGRFYPGRVFEEASAHGGWVTQRVYLGARAGKRITILFSSDPKAPGLEQIAVTVAAEKP